MGAASSSAAATSLPPITSATSRLHRALDAWDEAALAKALEAGGDARALAPVDPLEQFIVFAPDVERKSGAFALTALGRFASNLLSHMVAQETGLKRSALTRDTGPRFLSCLLAGTGAAPGGSVTAALHSRQGPAPGAAWLPGPASLVDALRLIVCAARGNEQLRRARAAFLLPTLLVALECTSPTPRACAARDLLFWGDLCSLEFLAPLAEAAGPAFSVLLPSGEAQPPLIAAVDAGSAHTVKLLLEAGASPNAARSSPNGSSGGGGGMTPLQRVAGDYAFTIPAPEAFDATPAGSAAAAAAAAAAGAAPSAAAAAATTTSEEERDSTLAHRPSRAMLEALLHAGADVHATVPDTGRTALHIIAVSNSPSLRADPSGRLALASRLLVAGASASCKDAQGATPGQLAVAARKDGARFAQGLEDAAAAAAAAKAAGAAGAAGAAAPAAVSSTAAAGGSTASKES